MATGTFTYDALRTKTLKGRIKTQKKYKPFILDKSNAVSVGTIAMKPYLSICLVGSVSFARYCGKMYNRHLFSYGLDYELEMILIRKKCQASQSVLPRSWVIVNEAKGRINYNLTVIDRE